MRKALSAAAVAVLVLLFLVANRGAYQGYFSDDELDNISWTGNLPVAEYARGLLSPVYAAQNFRPVGHFTFRELAAAAGLHFPWYVGFIHLLHLLNAGLVWLVLRKLGLRAGAAAAGVLFFALPMAAFDTLWKPMFLFDLYCAFFCLLSTLAWLHQRWVWSFILFWIACKSKEHAVMLPAVLACYEYWLGTRRWKHLLPFFAVFVSFGLQGVLGHRDAANDYTMEFTPRALWQTLGYYVPRILLTRSAALLLLLIPVSRDRRVWFGGMAAALMLVPLLALPHRMNAAYLYVSLCWLAVAFGSAAERLPWPVTAAFLAVWLPANYAAMRTGRKAALATAQENRAYVATLSGLPARLPAVRRFVYDGNPRELRAWGVQGALRVVYHDPQISLRAVDEPKLEEYFDQGPAALLSWDPAQGKLSVIEHRPGDADVPYLAMKHPMPAWQLGEGWYQIETDYRWCEPRATAQLWRPPGARRFGLRVNISPEYIQAVKRSTVHVFLDGREAGMAEFTQNGWQDRKFDLATAPAGRVRVELRVEPPFQPSKEDKRLLGLAVGGFGFIEAQ